jgi:hypothetical protein
LFSRGKLDQIFTHFDSQCCRCTEAVLRRHDQVFVSRPGSVVFDILLYGSSDVAFAPYGEYWRQARKLVTTHVLSVKKVKSFNRAATEGNFNDFAIFAALVDNLVSLPTCTTNFDKISGTYCGSEE